MTGRRYLTKRETLELFDKQEGRCARCSDKLQPGKFDADHSQPHAFYPGRKPDQLLCIPCHKEKTHTEDRPRIHKADRQGGRKGQWARRQKRGYSLIKGRGFASPEYRRRIKAKYEDKRT